MATKILALVVLCAVSVTDAIASQSNTQAPPPASQNPPPSAGNSQDTQSPPATAPQTSAPAAQPPAAPATPQKEDLPPSMKPATTETAWQMLKDAAASDKVRDRSDALSALLVVAPDPRATKMLEDAVLDKDESIRLLAVTSLGDIKAKSSIKVIDAAMQDASPQVSFAAAVALWKMGDRDGRDIFYSILEGDRKTGPGLVQSKIKEAKKEMHDPKALALIAVNQASGAFLGPFSMGVSMAEEYAKNNGAPVQTLCANLLASDNKPDTIEVLSDAADDKNWAIRVAGIKALAKLNHRESLPQMKEIMEKDDHQAARLVAAAAVIHLSEPVRAAKTSAPSGHTHVQTPAGKSPAAATTARQ